MVGTEVASSEMTLEITKIGVPTSSIIHLTCVKFLQPTLDIIIIYAIWQMLLSKATQSCMQTFYSLVFRGIEPTILVLQAPCSLCHALSAMHFSLNGNNLLIKDYCINELTLLLLFSYAFSCRIHASLTINIGLQFMFFRKTLALDDFNFKVQI